MAITLSIGVAIAANDAIVDLADGGDLEVRDVSETVLVSYSLNTPAFGDSATDGGSPPKARAYADLSGMTETPVANGTAHHYVVKDSGGGELWRGSCGLSGSGAQMILDTTTIDTAVDVTVVSWAFQHPTQA